MLRSPAVPTSLSRAAIGSLVAVVLLGAIGALAVETERAQSRTGAQLRRAARDQAMLGAALIDSSLETSGSPGPSAARVTTMPILRRDLAAVAAPGGRANGDRALLIDSGGRVLAASGPGGRSRGRYLAVVPLGVEPWRVVYSRPAAAMTGGSSLPFLLLAGLAVVAALGVFALGRLLAGTDRLTAANTELIHRNRSIVRATEAKTRFLARMSHELRTPLNTVIGFSELIHDGRTGPVSNRQREFVGIIRASANHLLTLINEVLDLSKIESGHMHLNPEATDPAAVADECVRSMQWLASDRGIRLELHACGLQLLRLDVARLRQVILNYLSNAIKFTGAGGQVTLTLARDGDRLLVTVTDTGIGISARDRDRVFDEFVQVGGGAGGGPGRSGTGLGLAVTRQIVEAQGGEVAVSSRLGFGSTFSAWLPWVPASVPAAERAAPVEARPSPLDALAAAETSTAGTGRRFRRRATGARHSRRQDVIGAGRR